MKKNPLKFNLLIFFLFFLGILCPFSPLLADKIVLKDGTQLVGKVKKRGQYWILEMPSGLVAKYSLQDVRRIERENLKNKGQKEKKQKGKKDWRKLYSLALKAKQEGRREEYRKLLKQVLIRNPHHYPSRMALGYVKYQGKWLKKQEFLKKIGYTKWKGKVAPKEEIQKAQKEEKLRQKIRKAKLYFDQIFTNAKPGEWTYLSQKMEKRYSSEVLDSLYYKLLTNSSSKKRLFALKEIEKKGPSPKARRLIVHRMINDPVFSLRKEAFRIIKKWGGPKEQGIPLVLKGLQSPVFYRRFAALGAVNAFHIKKALPILYSRIDSLGQSMQGPRQHAFFGTSRSYIKKWSLGSAGTQQQGQEVPDPEVDTFFEGVLIETQIVSIEYYLVRRIIQKLR